MTASTPELLQHGLAASQKRTRPLTERLRRQAEANRAAARAPNTVIAKVRDLRHFWSWAAAAHQLAPQYPIPAAIILDYLYAHQSQHSPNTLQRRLATLSQEHRDRGVANPCVDPQLRTLMKDLKATRVREGWKPRRVHAVTLEPLNALLATCGDDLKGARDRALLLVAFSSGGRRPSEVCNLEVDDLESLPEGSYLATLRLTKTAPTELPQVPIKGRAAVALRNWLRQSGITQGAIFRSISRNGQLRNRLITQRVGEIIKGRAALAGLDPAQLSGRSLRSGFMTEAGRQGLSLADAMGLSLHKTAAVAMTYFRPHAVLANPAATLAEKETAA